MGCSSREASIQTRRSWIGPPALRLAVLPVMLIFDFIICTTGYSLFLSFLSIRPRCKSYLAKLYSISHRMSRTGILLVEVIWHGAMARGRGGMMVRLSMSSTYIIQDVRL